MYFACIKSETVIFIIIGTIFGSILSVPTFACAVALGRRGDNLKAVPIQEILFFSTYQFFGFCTNACLVVYTYLYENYTLGSCTVFILTTKVVDDITILIILGISIKLFIKVYYLESQHHLPTLLNNYQKCTLYASFWLILSSIVMALDILSIYVAYKGKSIEVVYICHYHTIDNSWRGVLIVVLFNIIPLLLTCLLLLISIVSLKRKYMPIKIKHQHRQAYIIMLQLYPWDLDTANGKSKLDEHKIGKYLDYLICLSLFLLTILLGVLPHLIFEISFYFVSLRGHFVKYAVYEVLESLLFVRNLYCPFIIPYLAKMITNVGIL